MTEYLILYHDGREQRGQIDLPEPDAEWTPGGGPNDRKRYRLVRNLVLTVIGEGNYPEHVNVWHDGKYLDMFVDETSVLKDLPFNPKATAIYRANHLAHDPDPEPEDELPIIAGDAILFLEKVEPDR